MDFSHFWGAPWQAGDRLLLETVSEVSFELYGTFNNQTCLLTEYVILWSTPYLLLHVWLFKISDVSVWIVVDMCNSYALHVVIHTRLSFPPPTDSSCQKRRLTLLRFHQRRQLQLSNAELPECRARSAAAPYWAAFSKRSQKVPPVKQPVKMVLAACVLSAAKDRRRTPAMQMKPTYIQRPLCLPWLWRRSRWMWRSHLSRTWSPSKWRMLARTVSALVLRRHIALHQQKMWSPSSKVWPLSMWTITTALSPHDSPAATALLTQTRTFMRFFPLSFSLIIVLDTNTQVTNGAALTCHTSSSFISVSCLYAF